MSASSTSKEIIERHATGRAAVLQWDSIYIHMCYMSMGNRNCRTHQSSSQNQTSLLRITMPVAFLCPCANPSRLHSKVVYFEKRDSALENRSHRQSCCFAGRSRWERVLMHPTP